MRVVVLGAGYAGLTLARRLESRLPESVDLVVVDESDRHLVQHELHRVIRRPAVEDAITVPLRDVLDWATVRTARVEDIDREARRIHLTDDALDYDYAAVCLGAETAFYDLPGVHEHGLPLKRLDHAHRIREAFLDACEADGRAVVGGAGLSGVQVAGELAAVAAERDADVDVTVLERLDSVAPAFPEAFQSAVRDALDAAGVTVRTNARVTGATAEAVELDGRTIPYDTFVWTGGIRGPDAMGSDRPVVRGDLRLDDHTFAVGDVARVVDADGEAVPASAAAAIREARTVATNLDRLVRWELDGRGTDEFPPKLDPFRFDAPGWIASIGDDAVATVGPKVFTGGPARAMKATVGAGHLSSVGAISRAADLVTEELG
ncbi:NAD(P)/FAD-dependent oxidoreductase [Haloplanus aerogenes]|uniref:NADH dehydrogenase FAD-containing subunit n=1 Tax=Haloplanus aerogenes TaxID=660522 RepID=A0A3M0D2E6_9EURY|nr:FAD-dependent oxidoreductase [Haloplanus aerogenes]AZH25222.1 NADH dehydrogenase FAD-containing subunit [Haloplanus aerogenes]RMB13549.1 NADH dehydrogenase FAD-containing subunit [Haloplanus aerogenes]